MKFRSTLLALAVMSTCILTTSLASAQDTDKTTKTKKKKAKKDSSDTAAPAAAPKAPVAKAAASKSEPAMSAGVSAADISKAQSGGMVWVNTGSGVYHKSGRYYGRTKQGKFMSEADAKKANYHEAKEEVGTKK